MQAARGASQDEAAEPGPHSVPRSRRRPLAAFVVVAAVLLAVDQVTKWLAVEHLRGAPDKQLIGEVLQLRLAYNTGAAFSMGSELTEVLSIVAIVAVAVILWLVRRVRSVLWGVGLGVLVAGVAGNLTDRILREPGPLRGAVVDFLMLPNWPIFNVADMCINAAAALIILQSFRGVRLDGSRVRSES